MTDRELFPKINLAAKNATYLGLRVLLDWTDQVAEAFGDLLHDNQWFAIRKYSIARQEHARIEHLYRGEDPGNPEPNGPLHVGLYYQTSDRLPPGKVPKSLRGEGEILSRLSRLNTPTNSTAHVDFQFEHDEGMARSLWFPLPIPTPTSFSSTAAPVDEIRGIRGVKKRDEGVDDLRYWFILDRPTNQEITLSVELFLAAPLSAEAPQLAFREAVDLARRLGLRSTGGTRHGKGRSGSMGDVRQGGEQPENGIDPRDR